MFFDVDKISTYIFEHVNSLIKVDDSDNVTDEIEKDRIIETKPDLIISDISAMPFLVAKTLYIPSIAISNFSWYDVIDFISNDKSNLLLEAYQNADFSIKLPFGTKMDHFKKQKQVGLICRKTTQSKEKIRKKLKIKN